MSLQHVALEVREADTDAEVAFWALLGFEEVAPPEGLIGTSRWVITLFLLTWTNSIGSSTVMM